MKFFFRKMSLYMIAGMGAIVINFLLPRMLPGDPASIMFARFKGTADPEIINSLKETFGLHEGGLLQQFWAYLASLIDGDLGLSIAYYPAPVTEVISQALLWTIGLTGISVLFSFCVGTLLGIHAAWNRRSMTDRFLPPILTFLGSFPYFWLAMVLLFILGFTLNWFPLNHGYDASLAPELTWEFVRSVISHGFLPALSIVVATLGGWMLAMRNTMISVLGANYLTLAKAKGLSSKRVLFNYAARNAILPNITSFGMTIGFIISGSLLTEIIFSYPGQGYILIQAVRNQDYPLMQGIFLCITFTVLIANGFVDILTYYIDPKTREA